MLILNKCIYALLFTTNLTVVTMMDGLLVDTNFGLEKMVAVVNTYSFLFDEF